jgi:EAL domain-containing protein (putative c-di-GMP-specific phosphodiesterase class I)
MGDADELAVAAPAEGAERRPPSLGQQLPAIARRFDAKTSLGLIAIDASSLARIEGSFGAEAHERALGALGALVRELLEDRLGIGDLVVSGESGRDEILVVIFREAAEVEYYTRELPALSRLLGEGLTRRGGRVGYPHLREAPALHVGVGAALRNPTISAETQVRHALEEARDHAALNAKIEARRRRKRLFELVLAGKVRSVYEPIVEVETHTVFGYEALARGPEGSELYSPSALFQTATQTDLLFQLDCLCRRSGLEGARDLPGGAKLFLNVRPTTIHDPAFRAEAITQTLARSRLRPSDVVFEISEQESIQNFAIFRDVRDYYGRLGFQIALDDVGAGYSSLEAVMELEPQFIKVDRAFVSKIDEDPARQELLRALCTVAERIGARIIGEGLDTLEELETLGRLGIPFGQGWLFGKPTPLRHDL